MKLQVVAVGHRQPDWVSAGCAEYLKRMPRELPASVHEIKPEPRGSKTREQLLAAEKARIREVLPASCRLIVLDEKEGQLRAQAFIFPQETPESARPDDFLASIDEIERRTGLDFLPDLSTEAQARIESARAARTW
jgi:23S rRNA pseudoU1915 N3-methylase RlmH